MNGILLNPNETLILNLFDPGVILFGALFVLFGAAMTLVFLLKERAALTWPLLSILCIIECALMGILTLEFAGGSSTFYTLGSTAQLSELFLTHRWLLFQLPILLVASSIIILLVYRERFGEAHATSYRGFVIISVLTSFFTLLLIGLESLI
jgi:hypothetical protein